MFGEKESASVGEYIGAGKGSKMCMFVKGGKNSRASISSRKSYSYSHNELTMSRNLPKS